jgi:hypothetical protein
MSLQWRHTTKDDGRPFLYYETFEVVLDGKRIGSLQCKGPCRGLMAERPHTHGPWIAGVGTSMDLQMGLGLFASQREGAEAVQKAFEEGVKP